MKRCAFWLFLLAGILPAVTAGEDANTMGGSKAPATQPATQPAMNAAEIERLIQQLGSAKFAEREVAQKALLEIGPPAMETIRQAAATTDRERAVRARAILDAFEKQALAAAVERLSMEATDKDSDRARRAKNALLEKLRVEWGKVNDDVQARVWPVKLVWKQGETPSFKADVRNNATVGQRIVSSAQELCRLEVDGITYHWPGATAKRSTFPPGKEYADIPIMLVKDWRSVSVQDGAGLALTPGKHTLRVRFFSARLDGSAEDYDVETNTVEFEVLSESATRPATLPAAGKGKTDLPAEQARPQESQQRKEQR